MDIDIREIAIRSLRPNCGEVEGLPRNPRKISKKNLEKLKKSVQDAPEMLRLRELIVVPHDGEFVVIAGNQRLEAAKAVGMEKLPCKVLPEDTDPAKLREYAIKDNLPFGEDDWEIIASEWDTEELEEWGMSVPSGWKDTKKAEEDDFDPDSVKETVCKNGDIWKLGDHRLMCGDSTDADAVAKLMNGERADLVFTDPPYGMFLDVDYDGMFANDDNHHVTGKRFDKVKGDNDDFKPELITTIFDNFGDCPEVFIWGADYFSELIPNRKDGSWVVWDKRCSEEMEKVAGNTFELCWSKAKHKRLIARILWSGYHGMNGADSGKRVHPTQKPIALIDFFIKNWGDKANIIVDIFGGIGSTMIACEQLNRKCYMMELDPHYCDVIIARWEKLTGKKATRIN